MESKILTIACVQAIGHIFFQIYFIFGAWSDGNDVSSRYISCRPGVKNKRVIVILDFLSKWLTTQKLLHGEYCSHMISCQKCSSSTVTQSVIIKFQTCCALHSKELATFFFSKMSNYPVS